MIFFNLVFKVAYPLPSLYSRRGGGPDFRAGREGRAALDAELSAVREVGLAVRALGIAEAVFGLLRIAARRIHGRWLRLGRVRRRHVDIEREVFGRSRSELARPRSGPPRTTPGGGMGVIAGADGFFAGAGTVSSLLHFGQSTFLPAAVAGAASFFPHEHSTMILEGTGAAGAAPGIWKIFLHAGQRALLPASFSGTLRTLPQLHVTCMGKPSGRPRNAGDNIL